MRVLRTLLLLLLIIALFGGVGYYIWTDSTAKARQEYQYRVTLAVETAIAKALFGATSTAEADQPQYRVVKMGNGEPLLDVALRYNTTIEVLRMANKLLPTVDAGFGQEIIVPEGVQVLEPPRSFRIYVALADDTLSTLADRNGVPLNLLQQDNPVLAARGLNPGDIVFIPELL